MNKLMTGSALALVILFTNNAFAAENTVAPESKAEETVVVIGTGVRQTQTVKGEQLLLRAPGTSPIKLVERLPGVNYQGADAFGAYEWAVRINVRGFAQQQMGFTLDGIPLGDMSYGNFNGLHISRAIISENLGNVRMSQGAGLLGTNSTSNLGGTLQFETRKPADESSTQVSLTGGSADMKRIYGRFETGKLSGLGDLTAYLAYLNSETDKWKGDGKQKVSQYNFGFVWPIGDIGNFNGYYNKSSRRENDYQDLSKEMISRLGYDWDNISDNWALANLIADIGNNRGDSGAPVTNAAAGTVYPGKIRTLDDAYFDASGLRDDDLTRFGYDGKFFGNGTINTNIYSHIQKGQGLWFTPYVSPFSFGQGVAGVTSPVSIRTTEYDMDRLGSFTNISYDLGMHTITGGVWLERNRFNQARRFYANTRSAPNEVLSFQSGAFATQWAQSYRTETRVFNIQDTIKLNDALTLLAGFKSLRVSTKGTTPINGFAVPVSGSDGDLKGTIVSEDNFLPQVGLTYQVNNQMQTFVSYTENMRDLGLAAFGNRSQISFNAIKDKTKPESSKTLEGGLRLKGKNFNAVAAAYLVKFDDRLLAIQQGAGIIGNPSIISNVGGVETKGFELAGSYKFTPEINLFTSYAYNDSKYEDNVMNAVGAIIQATKGKTVVNAPKHLFKADIGYDNKSIFANLSANYTSERESTFTNIGGRVDAYTIVDLSLGYRFGGTPLLEGLEVQLNVTNLLDEEYISTIGSNGFSASDASETAQTFMVGAPTQTYITLRKKF